MSVQNQARSLCILESVAKIKQQEQLQLLIQTATS